MISSSDIQEDAVRQELPESQRIVNRSIRDKQSTFKKWGIRLMAAMGVGLTTQIAPGGELQNLPPMEKAKVGFFSSLWILVVVVDGKRRKFTKQQLDELAARGELEETLKTMMKENPEKLQELESLGHTYNIYL